MYAGIEKRNHKRDYGKASIRYADWDSSDFTEAILNNVSASGCSFGTDMALQPGQDLFVKAGNVLPERKDELSMNGNLRARVVWCRENPTEDAYGYTVGAEYVQKFWEKSYDKGVSHLDPAEWETTYIELIKPTFEAYPNKPAFYYMGTHVTFNELDRFANQFANMLIQNGLKKGDVVGINLPNIPEYIIAWLGILKAGCIVSGVSPLLSTEEMEHQLKDSDAKALVTLDAIFAGRLIHIEKNLPELKVVIAASVGGFLSVIKRTLGKLMGKIPKGRVTPLDGKIVLNFTEIINGKRFSNTQPNVELVPDDIAYLQYTGGTTGPPKGVMITHMNTVSAMLAFQAWGNLEKGDGTILCCFPLFHVAGLSVNTGCIYLGYSQILIPDPRNTDHICRELLHHKPRYLYNVPSLYQMLIKNSKFRALDHSNVEYCLSGASPFPEESQIELENIVGKGKLAELYGLTESTGTLTMNPLRNQKKLGSIGLPFINTDIKLIDPKTGKEVPVGQPGEICAKGPQIMKGYYKKPEETKKIFDADGYMHTGDVAIFDKEGYLTIVDRVKDMIIVGGYKVFSKKVEEILSEHPVIDMVALIGVPNPDRPGSEFVKAFITTSPEYAVKKNGDALKSDIIRFAKDKLAPYEVPKIIEFKKEMPLTAVGKIDKKVLRKEEGDNREAIRPIKTDDLHFFPEMFKEIIELNMSIPKLQKLANTVKSTIAFQVKGVPDFYIEFLGDKKFLVKHGEIQNPDSLIITSLETFRKIATKDISVLWDIITGKLKIKGLLNMAKCGRLITTYEKEIEKAYDKIYAAIYGLHSAHLLQLGIELGLFKTISNVSKGIQAQAIAKELNLKAEKVEIWCKTAYAQGFLEHDKRTGNYTMAPLMDVFLAKEDNIFYSGGGSALYCHLLITRLYPQFPDLFKTGKTHPFIDQDLEFAQKVSDYSVGIPLFINFDFFTQIHGLAAKLEKGIKILDIGCGVGGNLIYISKNFPNCKFVGIDLHEISVKEAREKIKRNKLEDRITVELGDASALDYREEFDLIMMIISLHEIPYDLQEKVIKECYNALKNEGIILIFDDTYPDKLEDLRKEEWSYVSIHQWFEALWGSGIVTASENKQRLLKANFKEVQILTSPLLQKKMKNSEVAIVGRK